MPFAAILAVGVLAAEAPAQADDVPGTYSVSWIGNTYGRGGRPSDPGRYWMQDYITQMVVQPDGACVTTSPWDEGGRDHGIYKDGLVVGNEDRKIDNQSIAAGGHRWTIAGGRVTSDDGRMIADAGTPSALGVAADGKLLVADNGWRRQIRFYDVAGAPRLTGVFGVRGGIGASYTAPYALPAAMNAPAYPAGTYGPGVAHPFKLQDLTGVGEDSAGRLFIGFSGGGTGIRCFQKNAAGRWTLHWRLETYCFVDAVDFDPATDGRDIYGVQEHYKLDYAKTDPGSEWSLFAYTADTAVFPHDPRNIDDVKAGHEHGLTSCWYRTVKGHRLLFTEGMTCQMVNIFRFEKHGERAIPSGLIMKTDHTMYGPSGGRDGYFWPPNRPKPASTTSIWRDANGDGEYQADEFQTTEIPDNPGVWPDSGGNLWLAGNPLTVRNLSGFDSAGNPIYRDIDAQTFALTGIDTVGHVQYQEDRDRMILVTAGYRELAGGKLYIVDRWKEGNRKARYVCPLACPHPAAFTVAGDYLFDGGWETRARVYVTDLRTGKPAGTMDVPDTLGGDGHTGNVDIGYGLRAYKRANDEYLVSIEDDYMSKVVLYRWRPGAASPGSSNNDDK
ncbi:hypothetical protein CCAX7_25490 [Capsulimonas corticalis]|uniref:Uncharacterized protein n=1 Tax=Capsulimonas corticalis TaxID=2219043 RepID=A0A402CVR6_9BACT|nr:hypothetical protein [Capsulimonas corticalis]BDI30498.1 hypothetical protein CCAX7_25490 [Capsulimonas corticalis]